MFYRQYLRAGLVEMQLIIRFNIKGFHYVFSIFSVSTQELFLLKTKKGITITQVFLENEVTQMNEVTNQAKYGQIKAVRFITDQ